MAGVERTRTRIRGFASDEMDFQLMRMLGVAYYGGGTPGEIMAARAAIPGDDPTAWPAAFGPFGERLDAASDDALASGHTATARDGFLRAASYLRSAEYFCDPFGADAARYGAASAAAFQKAAPHIGYRVEPVAIPFEGAALPGYLMVPPGVSGPNRTVLVLTGFDGTAEELFFHTGVDAVARGYTVLIAQGPGQVGTLRTNPDLHFRPDYEVPVAAMLDFAAGRPEIDMARLALYGISFGGYFAVRAAQSERRIRALIANSPIIDLKAYMTAFTEAGADEDLPLSDVDEVPDELMPVSVKLSFKAACRRFGVTSYFGWLAALDAYKAESLSDIACPVLAMVGDGEGRAALRQHTAFTDALSGRVTSRVFTEAEGADMHCQLGNLPLANAVVYDWLDGVFSEGE